MTKGQQRMQWLPLWEQARNAESPYRCMAELLVQRGIERDEGTPYIPITAYWKLVDLGFVESKGKRGRPKGSGRKKPQRATEPAPVEAPQRASEEAVADEEGEQNVDRLHIEDGSARFDFVDAAGDDYSVHISPADDGTFVVETVYAETYTARELSALLNGAFA